MLNKFEEIQNMSKTSIEATTTAFQTLSKSAQTITTEFADYSKRSFENGTKAMQSLLAVKSPEKAIEVQTDYVKAAYEDFTGGKILITEQEPLTDGTSGRHPHLVCNSPPRGAYECPRR